MIVILDHLSREYHKNVLRKPPKYTQSYICFLRLLYISTYMLIANNDDVIFFLRLPTALDFPDTKYMHSISCIG